VTTATAPPPRPLTPAQVRAYHDDGYVILRGLFYPVEMALASMEADRLLGHKELMVTENIRCRWQPHCDTGECLFETFDPFTDLSPALASLARDPRLLAAVGELYGEPAHLFKDKLIHKPPGAKGHDLHQDYIAWPSFPKSFVTAAVAREPLRAGLGISDLRFSWLNFWAIILGAACVMPVGRLIDRIGSRLTLALVAAALGNCVLLMSRAADETQLFVALTLVRGLGQGALSVVAIALIGKWFRRRAGAAMGVFTVLLGAAGGVITVVYFAVYGHTYGRTHLGRIQAAVQVLSVFALAVGPVILAACRDQLGTTAPFFYGFAAVTAVLAVAAWVVRPPVPLSRDPQGSAEPVGA
jgi:hypothetical protein